VALVLGLGVAAAIWKSTQHAAGPTPTPTATAPTRARRLRRPSLSPHRRHHRRRRRRWRNRPARAPASKMVAHRREPRHDAADAAPAVAKPAGHNRDYMIDPFATPKK